MGRTSRVALRGLGVVVAAVVAGCWWVPDADSNRTRYNPHEAILTADTVGGLTSLWTWTSPSGVSVSNPVVSAGGVHVTSGCHLTTVDGTTGAVVWEAFTGEFGSSEPFCSIAGGGGNDSYGEPFVVDGTGGQEVAVGFGTWILRPPGFTIADYTTRHFDTVTGADRGSEGGFTVARRGTGRVSSDIGPAAPGFQGNSITVDSVSFTLAWSSIPDTSFTLGQDLVFHAGYGALVTVPGSDVRGYGVRAFSRTQQPASCGPVLPPPPIPNPPAQYFACPMWATPTAGPSTIPVLNLDGDTLYTRAGDTFYAIDAASGAVRWTATGLGNGGQPALTPDTVYVPTGDGRVLRFAAGGCGAVVCEPTGDWHVDTGTAKPVTSVTVAGDIVYAVADGTVSATAPCVGGACPVLWSAPGTGTPVVSAGHLYIKTNTTTVAAYGLPAG